MTAQLFSLFHPQLKFTLVLLYGLVMKIITSKYVERLLTALEDRKVISGVERTDPYPFISIG